LVGIGIMEVVVFIGGMTTTSVVELISVETETLVEVETTVETLVVDSGPLGMLKVTPADWQRVPAAAMVASSSAAEQAPWTQGRREVTKAVAWQIQAMSVVAQPVLPKLVMAQLKAHGGIWSSWAEAVYKPAATAMIVEAFILNDLVILILWDWDLVVGGRLGF